MSDSVWPNRRQPTRLPVPGTLQARTLEWVAISFSSAWKWKVKVKLLSRVWLLATPWTVAHQAPPSMGFSRQEYWSGVPLPSPKNFHKVLLIKACLKRLVCLLHRIPQLHLMHFRMILTSYQHPLRNLWVFLGNLASIMFYLVGLGNRTTHRTYFTCRHLWKIHRG